MQFYKGDIETSMRVAEQVLTYLRSADLPVTPELYELFYVYYAELNVDIVRELRGPARHPESVTLEQCQTIYARYLSQDRTESAVKRAGEQIQETIRDVNTAVADVKQHTENFGKNLQKTVQTIKGTDDPGTLRTAVSGLVMDTQKMMETSYRLHDELDKSARVIHELQRNLEIVRREAMTDGLTGLANRKSFDQEIKRILNEAKLQGHSFTLLMVDIDHFKSFNDNFGHLVGDQVLRLVGRTLIEGIKGRDFAARYGGEEFAIILPDSNIMAGMAVGNSLRKSIALKDVMNRTTGEKLGRITMSVGVAEYTVGESPEEMIERADSALYTAKHNGRNQVAAAPAPKSRVG